jgi:hypothetical protein
MLLLPDVHHSDPTITALGNLVDLLQSGNFTEAWTLCRDDDLRAIFNKIDGFDNSIRQCEWG